MKTIQQTGTDTYALTARGHAMTLERRNGEWVMTTVNASVHAYSHGVPARRYFGTLADVEKAYKSWKGIQKLHFSFNSAPQQSN